MPKIVIEPTRISKVDTRLFFDPKNGIKGFVMPKSGRFEEFCYATKKCEEAGKFLDEFAIRRGFSLIFDSSKPLDPTLQKIACDDVTTDFIADYNKHLVLGIND